MPIPLIDQHRRDDRQLSVSEVLLELTARVLFTGPVPERHRELQHAVAQGLVSRLIATAGNVDTTPGVRRDVEWSLRFLQRTFEQFAERNDPAAPQSAYFARQIKRFLERPLAPVPEPAGAADAPPGSPIGQGGYDLGRCSHDR